MTDAEGIECHQDNGDECDGKADAYPDGTFGAHHGFKEMSTGIQSQAGQVEGKTDTSEHQVGTSGRIGYQTEAGTEAAYQDSYDDGTACQA